MYKVRFVRFMRRGISGLMVVRNAVKLGYPLYFSVKSIIGVCDEFVISEGFSEDSTMNILRELQAEYPSKVRIVHHIWKPSSAGETIAEVTNNAMAACDYDWIYYIQADEIVHEDNLRFIGSVPRMFDRYKSIFFRFTHFRPSLRFEMIGGYTHAIRMVRNYSSPWRRNLREKWQGTIPGRILRGLRLIDPLLPLTDVYSAGDGWNFSGNVRPILRADFLKPIFHVGYVNRDREVVAERLESHAELLYASLPGYRRLARAIRAGEEISEWRGQGMRIVPYPRRDYPKLLLDWAVEEGIEYVS